MKNLVRTIAAAAAVVCSLSCVTGRGGRVANVPHLSLEDTDGRSHYLSDYIGRKKTVVVTFWATWCTPCKDELPVLQQIYRRERENGLQVLAIAMDGPETLSRVAPLVRQMGLTFPVLLDTDSRAVALYNPKRSAPMLHIFDADGRIVYSHTTFRRSQARALERKIRAVLGGDQLPSRRRHRRRDARRWSITGESTSPPT